MGYQNESVSELTRRKVLRWAGISTVGTGLLTGSTAVTAAAASSATRRQGNPVYEFEQDGETFDVVPLSADTGAPDFYGNVDGDGSYELDTATDVDAAETTNVFLYQAPDGTLSLVLTLDTPGDDTGGAATFQFEDLPRNGSWTVTDDPADFSNAPTRVDWDWTPEDGDGGVFTPFELTATDVLLEERLQLQPDGSGEKIPLSNPWNYYQRFDQPLEGFEPPVYVAVFADNAPFEEQPPEDQPKQAFRIEGESVVLEADSSTEPTNDVYFVVKPGTGQTTVKFIGESAGFDNQLYYQDELLFENTNTAPVGETFAFGTPASGVTVTPDVDDGIETLRALSGSATAPDTRSLDPAQPFQIRRKPDAGAGEDFQTLANTKRELISDLRSITSLEGPTAVESAEETDYVDDEVVGLLSETEASGIDTDPESLTEELTAGYDGASEETRAQYREALDRLVETERLSKTAAVQTLPIVRQTGDAAGNLLFTLGTVIAGPLFRGGSNASDDVVSFLSKRIDSKLVDDLVNGARRIIDGFKKYILGPVADGVTEFARPLIDDTKATFDSQFPPDSLQKYFESVLARDISENAGDAAGIVPETDLVDFKELISDIGQPIAEFVYDEAAMDFDPVGGLTDDPLTGQHGIDAGLSILTTDLEDAIESQSLSTAGRAQRRQIRRATQSYIRDYAEDASDILSATEDFRGLIDRGELVLLFLAGITYFGSLFAAGGVITLLGTTVSLVSAFQALVALIGAIGALYLGVVTGETAGGALATLLITGLHGSAGNQIINFEA